MSAQRQEKFAALMPLFQPQPNDLRGQSGRDLHIEIGCGKGESILHYARAYPEALHFAFEVYTPGLATLIDQAAEAKLENIRAIAQDALDFLPKKFASSSIAQIRVFYPDPWPKKRHHKRRLVNSAFLELARELLVPGGEFKFATDNRDYFEVVCALASSNWKVIASGSSANARGDRPQTRFEQRALQKGSTSYDLRLVA